VTGGTLDALVCVTATLDEEGQAAVFAQPPPAFFGLVRRRYSLSGKLLVGRYDSLLDARPGCGASTRKIVWPWLIAPNSYPRQPDGCAGKRTAAYPSGEPRRRPGQVRSNSEGTG
jgi:hypothetical protein